MDNALKNTNTKFILIGKINGLAAQAKGTSNRIRKAKAKKNTSKLWRLAHRKHVVGIDIRHHLLAYAFLRGTPYRKLEAKCGEFNQPYASLIFKVIEQHAPYYVTRPFNGAPRFMGYTPTLDDVKVWLAASEEQ
jgi:hypothetical protein